MQKTIKLNHTCAICGTKYHACDYCESDRTITPWKRHTDTSEHYKIYQILHGYNIGVYDKKEAQKKLDKVDLSDKDTYLDYVKENIDSIMLDK